MRVLHVVAADDQEHDETIVITTYEPDPNESERRRPGRHAEEGEE